MASTYEPIATTTLSTASSSVTFSSIPQTYTDLVLVWSGLNSASNAEGFQIKVNSGSGTLQSLTRLQGNGSTASSAISANGDPSCGVTGNAGRDTIIANIMNYSNSTTYKTIISRYNSTGGTDDRVGIYVNLTRDTAAITSLLISSTSGNFISGSTFTLYGIKAA